MYSVIYWNRVEEPDRPKVFDSVLLLRGEEESTTWVSIGFYDLNENWCSAHNAMPIDDVIGWYPIVVEVFEDGEDEQEEVD